MMLLDTNVILRYLLDDIKEQADIAERVINEGAYTLVEIIAEVVYVLTKTYGVSRQRVSEMAVSLLDEVFIHRKDIVVCGLQIYADTSFDFVDCLLVARKQILGENILTFDKKLAKRLSMP